MKFNPLSQNINLRNTLQKSIGPLKTSSNGLSVAQLRAAKREKRKMNINQETAALPLDSGVFFMILTQLFLNQSLQHCRLELMIIVNIIEIVCMKTKMLINLIILFQQHQRLHSAIKTL